ncbi:bifunctional DNA primase/polymerase [Catenulispora sp. NF23]|uniref:bifunctional DNA primase/polymerase n=1 Tax=Catenulispora pinistramenti TaxID=2705254 RepID=UPI001BAA238A|nr:bifunctional DNA primase/polymerase [Catenulispora pinistramenti]MBS2536593.1 bifunctional DNA primase/polymerase [Catenulispora pinistramenti]
MGHRDTKTRARSEKRATPLLRTAGYDIRKDRDPMTKRPAGLAIALALAELGWHVFPLSPSTKGPLANCKRCDTKVRTPHPIENCSCIADGRWCHGVRAATTNPARITAWWRRAPHAVPGIAAGPSGLVLIDIDTHGEPLPDDHATAVLPGIDLRIEMAGEAAWRNRDAFRTGRDSLNLLAHLRGRRNPWPGDAAHQPLVVTTPSGGTHLWYRAPDDVTLHQALASTCRALAWKVDVKAGWSYGIAPGATTAAGTYTVTSGTPANIGRMPDWLMREVIRVAGPEHRASTTSLARPTLAAVASADRGTRYLLTVLDRGDTQLRNKRGDDGRKQRLAALAYQAGGLIHLSQLTERDVIDRLTDTGIASGLPARKAEDIARSSLANGQRRPLAIRN